MGLPTLNSEYRLDLQLQPTNTDTSTSSNSLPTYTPRPRDQQRSYQLTGLNIAARFPRPLALIARYRQSAILVCLYSVSTGVPRPLSIQVGLLRSGYLSTTSYFQPRNMRLTFVQACSLILLLQSADPAARTQFKEYEEERLTENASPSPSLVSVELQIT